MLFSFLLQKVSLTSKTTPTRKSFSTLRQTSIKFNTEQQNILKDIEQYKSVFITGAGGTGKSFLLLEAIHLLKRKIYRPHEVFVTASTGVAGYAINGQTLHSFAGVGLGEGDKDDCLKRVLRFKPALRRWQKAKALVIDEVGMVNADFFDILEYVARNVKQVDKPWGGIQMIVSGDFFQLPPISNKEFAFEADSWESSFDLQVELTENFRQSGDRKYTEMLHRIRRGKKCEHDLESLRQCGNKPMEKSATVPNLFPLKEDADRVNEEMLGKLMEDKKIGTVEKYTARDTGKEPWKSQLQNGIAPKELQLCAGAIVMLIKNIDLKNGLVNGAVGTVTGFSLDKKACKRIASKGYLPIVKFNSGITVRVKPEKWEMIADDRRLATRRQIPLMLAWATSIHKIQGMTLDCLHTDLSKAFGHGMVYVALSRVRSLDGLYLSGFDPSKIQAHPKVLEFYDNLSRKGERYEHHLEILPQFCNKPNKKSVTVQNLFPRKDDAVRVNEEMLGKLKEDKKTGNVEKYTIKDTGKKRWKSRLQKWNAPKEPEFCIGARVMFIENKDLKNGLVNNAVGTVISFRLDNKARNKGFLPIVKFDSGEIVRIEPEIWEVEEDDRRVATRRQIPLMLACELVFIRR